MAFDSNDTFSGYNVPVMERDDENTDVARFDETPAEVNDTFDDDAADGSEDTDGGSTGKARTGQKSNKPLIRRTAQKAVEVYQAPELRRDLAAALLGCAADPTDLTVAVMTAGRSAGAALADLAEIRTATEENPMMAGVLTLSLGKPRLKAVWTVLHTLGAVGKQMNASDTKAAMDAGSAIGQLSREQLDELEAAGELIKRS